MLPHAVGDVPSGLSHVRVAVSRCPAPPGSYCQERHRHLVAMLRQPLRWCLPEDSQITASGRPEVIPVGLPAGRPA